MLHFSKKTEIAIPICLALYATLKRFVVGFFSSFEAVYVCR
jgi:hypothetical protein